MIQSNVELEPDVLEDLLSPGSLFAEKYRILAVLGQGGMGVVYKAEHLFMKRIVALKTVLTALTANSTAAYRFAQEAKAASSLSHPNIVGVHDFGIANGNAYLVMDYLEGRTLAHDQLSFQRFTHIFKQACDALEHAHKRGVIHRDLKCGNLMLVRNEDDPDFLKLVDFGLAKIISPERGAEQQSLTTTGMIVGSPLYMSPEQCRGRELDARSDIYSLGCVMYEALTGEPPLVGETALDTMCLHLSQNAPSMLELNQNIDPRLDQLVAKMLKKEPDQRPQSMAAVSQELNIAPMAIRAKTTTKARPSGKKDAAVNAQQNTAASRFAAPLPATDNSSQIWQGALLGLLLMAAGGVGAIAMYGPGSKTATTAAQSAAITRKTVKDLAPNAATGASAGAARGQSEAAIHHAEANKASAAHAKNTLANHMNTEPKPAGSAHLKHLDPYTEYDLPRPDRAQSASKTVDYSGLPLANLSVPGEFPPRNLPGLQAGSAPPRPVVEMFRRAKEHIQAVQYYGDSTTPVEEQHPQRNGWFDGSGDRSIKLTAEKASLCVAHGDFENAKRHYESIRGAIISNPRVLGSRPHIYEEMANIAGHMQYSSDAAVLHEAACKLEKQQQQELQGQPRPWRR